MTSKRKASVSPAQVAPKVETVEEVMSAEKERDITIEQPAAKKVEVAAKPIKKAYEPQLVKILGTGQQVKFYKVATNSETGEFLGVAAFALPHHEDRAQLMLAKAAKIKPAQVKFALPVSLRLLPAELAKVSELLRGITRDETDRMAYNAAFGKNLGSTEISSTVRLS